MALSNRKRSGGKIEIPMSAMIDVVFLLLIYFIVTYRQEIPEAHLQVNLPAPDAAPRETEPTPPLELTVLPEQFLFRNWPMGAEGIQRALLTLTTENDPQNITVLIKTHVNAPTRNLVTILDICRSVNITNLNVMTLE